MKETSSSQTISTKLERIAKLAKEMPGVPLSTLAHHIDIDWLHEAYRRTRKDAAVGVDGQTAAEYEANLEDNLRSLLDRAKSGDLYWLSASSSGVTRPRGSHGAALRALAPRQSCSDPSRPCAVLEPGYVDQGPDEGGTC